MLPAYNEALNLPSLLKRIAAAGGTSPAPRVLVIDDGSSDDTSGVARAAAGRLVVDVVRHDHNRGLAAAVKTGIREVCRRAADDDTVVIMDADDSHPPELVPVMVRQLDLGCQIVIASRFAPGGREVGVPWHRRFLSRAASLIFRGIWRIRGIRDYTTGFRAYRANVLKRLWALHDERLIETTGFSVMTEILVKARPLRPRIAEVPLVLRYDLKRGSSKMRFMATIRDYARLIRRTSFRM